MNIAVQNKNSRVGFNAAGRPYSVLAKMLVLSAAFVLSCHFSVSLCASDYFSRDAVGTAGAQFLKLGAGARATAMGNAFSAVADDSTALYWNPAGLYQTNQKSLVVAHNIMFEDIYYDWASFSKPIDSGVIGIGVQYLSYGNIMGRDNTELETGNFQPNDLAVTLGYARMICGVTAGANLKYITSKIVNTASAGAIDIGGMYKMMKDKLALAAVVQNLGTKMKFIDEKDRLPMNVKLGGSYDVMKGLIADVDVNFPIDNHVNVCVGSEYSCRINADINASVRVGYTSETKDVGGLNGITAGAGGEYKGYALDYSFSPFGDLGNIQRISLGIKF